VVHPKGLRVRDGLPKPSVFGRRRCALILRRLGKAGSGGTGAKPQKLARRKRFEGGLQVYNSGPKTQKMEILDELLMPPPLSSVTQKIAGA